MKLGFHYHVPAFKDSSGQIWMPGHLALFVESIAAETEEVVCFLHTPIKEEMEEMDYQVLSKNISLVSLGPHSSVPSRVFRAKYTLTPLREQVRQLDALLVRAPSPLSPYFYRYFKHDVEICLLLVGNYLTTKLDLPFFRKKLVHLFFLHNYFLQKKAVSNCLTLVNNRVSYDENQKFAKELHEVKTTTLSIESFYERKDTCQTDKTHLLYTGRFDMAKGLLEMIKATELLYSEGFNVYLNFVGWELQGKTTVTDALVAEATRLGIRNRVIFHGKKQVGNELNQMYRQCDIYIIASKGSEGFPRTLWEAMANSLPCIATSVGSIPHYLIDESTVLLVMPGNVADLIAKIKKLICDSNLRQRLIQKGRELARQNTLEIQAKKITSIIQDFINKRETSKP